MEPTKFGNFYGTRLTIYSSILRSSDFYYRMGSLISAKLKLFQQQLRIYDRGYDGQWISRALIRHLSAIISTMTRSRQNVYDLLHSVDNNRIVFADSSNRYQLNRPYINGMACTLVLLWPTMAGQRNHRRMSQWVGKFSSDIATPRTPFSLGA